MSQRISVTRVIALNWYGFRQIFDIQDNVLISGVFGTGKSAILDLMQYVLLGEHWRANRAAAGNARGRDLVSYCLGDTNQVRNGQRHFLRQNGVTLVALEFTKPARASNKEPQRETWGIRLEYSSPDAAPKHTYFCIPERLNYEDVAPDGELLADDAFRTWIRREYGNEYLFARQREYLEEMATARRLNFDPAAFHRTFPKAIAFEPEENVEKFIREFILEESPLNVQEVRTALRSYDETRQRLERQEHEAEFLRKINQQHAIYESAQREQAILKHLQHALRHAQAVERQRDLADRLKRLEDANADDLKALEAAKQEEQRIKTLLDAVRFEVSKDPDAVKIADLRSRQEELQQEVASLEKAEKSARQRLDELHQRWVQWIRHGAELKGLPTPPRVDDQLLAQLRSGPVQDRLGTLPSLASRFSDLWRETERATQPVATELATAEKKLRQLADDLKKISAGQAPGTFPLLEAIRQKLGGRGHQVSRLIEVKPEAENWWPALERFLDDRRWAIITDTQEDYVQALKILKKTTPGRESESLVNPSEVHASSAQPRENSLFERVTVSHPIARAYTQLLLGHVACVESAGHLETVDADCAISPDGGVKQVPVRRQLKLSPIELTLGAEGLERMRKLRQKEHDETELQIKVLSQQLQDIHAWLDLGRKSGLGDNALPDRAAELPRLPKLKSQLGSVQETIKLLMTPEREARQNQLAALERQNRQCLSNIATYTERKNQFELKAAPQREALERANEDAAAAHLASEESRVMLSRRFHLLDSELTERGQAVRLEFPNWQDCFNALADQISDAGQEAIQARERRNTERRLLATDRDVNGALLHPEYQHEFSVEDEDNSPWARRLETLETVELKKSRELAADRKKEWERRLEDNVLNELNRRITDASNTIRLLDRYLSQPIGKFRYRLTQRRDTAGYEAIWRLLDSGLEPTDPLAAAIQDAELQRAKDDLTRAVDAPDSSDDRVKRLLDYRNYHRYDIEMIPADKPDAPPISLGRSGRNLSGGESQAPFFISILAAFRRVYDRGDRSSTRSQQLGLVVMDEAFSKLSGDGIEDCLALAQMFQLQLIMAFPPERLGVMVPHAQTVIICQKELERDSQGYVTRIDNIPLIMSMADAMEALT